MRLTATDPMGGTVLETEELCTGPANNLLNEGCL